MTQEAGAERAAFEELPLGIPMEPIEHTVDAEMVKRYADAIGSTNPWFFEDSPFGGPIVPPTILENLALRMQTAAHRIQVKGGYVHSHMESEYLKPVLVGTTVRVEGHLAGKYIRRDKYYLVTEFHVHDAAGDEVLKGRIIEAALPDPSLARWQ